MSNSAARIVPGPGCRLQGTRTAWRMPQAMAHNKRSLSSCRPPLLWPRRTSRYRLLSLSYCASASASACGGVRGTFAASAPSSPPPSPPSPPSPPLPPLPPSAPRLRFSRRWRACRFCSISASWRVFSIAARRSYSCCSSGVRSAHPCSTIATTSATRPSGSAPMLNVASASSLNSCFADGGPLSVRVLCTSFGSTSMPLASHSAT
mmetsp:Transcript_6860/g.20577  ORF Transcript_6860/g.20577 Transcript_6860/m.20577 type:complete len:206 (-) Transcript_6860:411-1028(-)